MKKIGEGEEQEYRQERAGRCKKGKLNLKIQKIGEQKKRKTFTQKNVNQIKSIINIK